MALQTGMGLSRILILVGAGYTGTILVKNGKLSDLLGELQLLLKGIEKSGDQSEGDADAIAAQVRRLAMEVRQMASGRQITVLNGNSGQIGNLSSLVVPAATLGALGYGYMWWKGLSFSDLMYVTKSNMANAVSNLTKHLENVSEALAAAKRHLTQRIENLDDKVEKQNELSKLIENDVAEVKKSIGDIGYDVNDLKWLVKGLGGKIGTLEEKQDFANYGILYLCNFFGGNKGIMPEAVKEQLKVTGKSRSLLTYPDSPSLKGLKDIADTLAGGLNRSASDAIVHDGVDNRSDEQPRHLIRKQVVLVGQKPSIEFESMLVAARASYDPNKTVIHVDPSSKEETDFREENDSNVALMAKNNYVADKVVALVSQNFTCGAPVTDPGCLMDLLSQKASSSA